MSYKTIAVHLDASPRCATRVALAARLAVRHGGRLVGIAPTGLPDVIVAMNSAIPDAIECIALSAADLRENADAAARAIARRAMRVVRQNLAWAIAYNAVCVPVALLGWFPPWAAGLGMATSSLVVVLNALRIDRGARARSLFGGSRP